MQNSLNKYKWLIALWLVFGSCMQCYAYASEQVAQPASWGQTSTYSTMPSSSVNRSGAATGASYGASYGSSFGSRFSTGRRYAPEFENAQPSFRFQSTSRYAMDDDNTSGMTMQSGPRRATFDWSEPTDDPVGVMPSTPVGEPLVLLAMALLYVSAMYLRRRSASL